MDDQFQKLVELFNFNTDNAIKELQRIICFISKVPLNTD